MKNIKSEISEKQKKGKKGTIEQTLSSCLKAPSAEHARAHDVDEPCDDSRAGGIDEDLF